MDIVFEEVSLPRCHRSGLVHKTDTVAALAHFSGNLSATRGVEGQRLMFAFNMCLEFR